MFSVCFTVAITVRLFNLASKKKQPDRITPDIPSSTGLDFIDISPTLTEQIRLKSRKENTSVAAVLVVVGMIAARSAFDKLYNNKVIGRQGWVLTNSLRHLIPGSELKNGADKHVDPATSVFGSYSGSVSDAACRLTDSSLFWKKCRMVKSRISTINFSSVARLKLIKYVSTKPRLYKYLQKSLDLKKFTRSYAVEVANLGAWDKPKTDVDLSHFGGMINANYDGARALFTIVSITIDGAMSIGIGYDTSAVHEEDAIKFKECFVLVLERLVDSEKNVRVGALRRMDVV